MVMQVKRTTFQRMGSGGEGKLKTDEMYQVDSLHRQKCILYFHGKYIKKSADDRQSDDRSVPVDIAECCSVSEISI